MAAPSPSLQPASPDQQSESKWPLVERLIKTGTALLALIYGAGFLVVSVHHGQYGVLMFEFLRARVFAAGILFAALTVAPVVAISRLLGLFGLQTSPPRSPRFEAEHPRLDIVSSIATFPVVAWLLAMVVRNIFISSTPTANQSTWWMLLGLGPLVIALAGHLLWLRSHPLFVSVAYVVAGVLYLFSIHKWESERSVVIIVYWFCGVAVGFMVGVFMFAGSGGADHKRFEWERYAFISLGVVFWFATLIYGRIKPSWGGGALLPVAVHFARTTPFSSSPDVKAYLIDETDKGYYLAHNADDRKATFIPRDAVVAVDYEELK